MNTDLESNVCLHGEDTDRVMEVVLYHHPSKWCRRNSPALTWHLRGLSELFVDNSTYYAYCLGSSGQSIHIHKFFPRILVGSAGQIKRMHMLKDFGGRLQHLWFIIDVVLRFVLCGSLNLKEDSEVSLQSTKGLNITTICKA